MSSLVSFHLDNVEYNADRIARLFPKCKPKTFVNGNVDSDQDSQTCSTIDINRNSLIASNENDGDHRQLMDADNNTMHDANVIDVTTEKSSNEKNTSCNGNINNALSADNDSSCSRASSPFDMSDEDDDSDEVSSPRTNLPSASDASNVSSQHHQPYTSYHPHHHHHHHHYRSSGHFHHPQTKRKMHRVQSAVNQYKLRDSRIIEIAGGRELFSQSRSKACRKARVYESEKSKSPGRVWELRARMSEDKKQESSKEITETVFSSEIKSVKHPQTISLGINGSVVFDDIDENWKSDNSAIHIPKRTYQTNNSTHNNSDKDSKLDVCDKVDASESSDRSNWEANKISPALHVIGSLPIAEYEGSPRRYGVRTSESVIPTLLSSPTFTIPRPGFPQRIVDESSVSSSSAATSSLPPSTSTSFNYLYEYSETRKVLEEFFKPDETPEKMQQPFRELEYELKRRRKLSLDQGNSYVASRLAEGTDGNTYSSPKKISQDSSEYSNSQEPGFLSNYTVSTENLGLPLEFQMSNNDKNAVHHSRYSISPDLERCFRQSRNFTLSPDTTDCESNFGEGDSDISSLMLVADVDAPAGASTTANGPTTDRLYLSMPILEDGLSSGHTSDNENNNATVRLMKKQISEIEREITEKSNRPPIPVSAGIVNNTCSATTSSSSLETTTTTTIAVTSAAAVPAVSSSTFKPGSVVPSVINLSSQNNSNCANPIIIEPRRPTDIDLELLDPLASVMDRHASSPPPPPAPAPHRETHPFQQQLVISNQNVGTVEDTIKDIRMTLQRTKTLPLRPLCVTNSGDNEDHESSNSVHSETPIWIPRRKGAGSGASGDEDDLDTDLETDRLLGQQRNDDQGFFDENIEKENAKKKNRNKEGLTDPSVLIEGVLFRARYLGSTQLVCEGQPTKATRMMQAEEAVSRIKAPEGESQPRSDVDLFISTEKIMVLNTDLKEIMMDHALRTISYIADIGDLVVLMARRRLSPQDIEDQPRICRVPSMVCHVFESEEAQFIAQSIGQAFQVAYMEFLKANGIEDHSFVKEMDYQEVLNSQEIFGDELQMFAKKELQKEVVVPKMKGEILGVVIVESGWGSMLPTVVIANLAPAGAAARCGQLNIGDQIIAVNGVSLVGLPLSTCQNYIKNSKPHNVVKLTVVPCAPVVEVKIKRPDTKYQLGFSVQNGVICSLLRGGIAERGGVRVGHRIIEINNQSVVAVPHEKIVTLLATSVGEILMKTMPTSMFRLLTGQETPVFI